MIKILALVNNGGSKYHRVIVPLESLPKDKYRVDYAQQDFITEEMVRNYDIIYIHWMQKTKCELISLWKERYGFKIVLDIDDYWDVPAGHHLREQMKKSVWQLENQLILADVVLCATEFLLDKCRKYNDNCRLRKNYLPLGLGQFYKETNLLAPNNKIKIGICGSISHLPDWMSLKGQLEKIKNDKEIQDNCIFIVAGYNDSNKPSKDKWDKIVNLFNYKKNGKEIKPLILKSLSPDSYMAHYKLIDILLAPLEVNDFNRAKSELKLFEAGCKSAVVISNEIYKEKGYNDYLVVDKDNSYYSRIKSLMDRDYLNEKKVEFQENLLEICKQNQKKYDLQDIFDSL